MREVQLGEAADASNGSENYYVPAPEALGAAPWAVDLRGDGFPPIRAQGVLNSCTAHVLAALIRYDTAKRGCDEAVEPSCLFIYYNQRDFRRETGKACHGRRGAPVRMDDGIRSIRATGFCCEAQWPYVETLFDVRPAPALYEYAARYGSHQYLQYLRLAPDIAHLKACLVEGYPFACGIAVYESFLGQGARESGFVTLPASHETPRGGHAVAVVGYDDRRGHFIARNSFGPRWGDGGHCYLPYAFLADPSCSFDFWIVRSASHGGNGTNKVKDARGA